MTAQTNTITGEPTTVASSPTVQSSSQSSNDKVLGMGQLAALLGHVQDGLGQLANTIAHSDGAETVDSTGKKAGIPFSQMLGNYLIECTQKAAADYIANLAKQQSSSTHSSIFKKIALAFTMLVAACAAVLAPGPGTAFLLLTTTLMVSMSAAGKQDPFQMAAQKLADKMAEKMGDKAFVKLFADVAICGMMAIVTGGAGVATCGIMAGEVTSEALLLGATIATEATTQTFLETNGAGDVTSGIVERHDLDPNARYVTAMETGFSLATLAVNAGATYGLVKIGNKALARGSSMIVDKVSSTAKWDPVTVNRNIGIVQTCSQAAGGAANIAAGSYDIKAARFGRDADINDAMITRCTTEVNSVSSVGQQVQDMIAALLAEIYAEQAALTKSASSPALAQELAG